MSAQANPTATELIAQKQEDRKASVQSELADTAALARLIAGKTLAPADHSRAIAEFLKRAGFSFAFVTRLLETGAQASAQHVIRLAALHLHLERSGLWNDSMREAVVHIERQLARALTPSQYQNDGTEFAVPLRLRKGRYRNDQAASIDSAEKTIAMLAQELGVPDLSETPVLDIGCGVKFTQAFYGRGVPVKEYHGVDVDSEMIDFLASNVFDSRFSFKHIDVYNGMYNTRGERLSEKTDIGAAGRQFDLICLFSVFTHLAPKDYRSMLRLTRKYVAPYGKLIYTGFIDETIRGRFKDAIPGHPLLKAVYRQQFVSEMLASTKWNATRIFKQDGTAKIWFVCEPV
jgi:2-polyprenyl-3-methyl-5-hydroxy-6-metoxy-1,4-benzoquinol methylase